MGNKRKIIYILVSSIIFALFFFLMLIPLSVSGTVLDKGSVVTLDGQTHAVSFPDLYPLASNHEVSFQFHFSNPKGDTLVIRRPSANALKISLNGTVIYTLGDTVAPTANIWNNLIVVPLAGHLIEGDNLLEIRLYSSSYDIGLSVPPYIVEYPMANIRSGLGKILFNDFLNISIGAAINTGLILLVLASMRKPVIKGEIFMGIACILAAIFCFDYTYRLTTGSLMMFFWIKKFLMISGYVSALFFLIGMELYLNRRFKIGKFMTILTSFSVLLILLAWNSAVLVKMINYLNVVFLLNIAGAIFVIIRLQKQKPWMIIPAVLLILSMVQMVVLTALNLSYPFVMQYVILASSIVFGISMIHEFNQLYRENFELEQKANRDPLTGVYNRNILAKIAPHPDDVLVIMDIDNLKMYNDKFGHLAGDQLLISLTDTVCSSLRQSDLVIRYGGDEFILILRDTSVELSERIIERIRQKFIQKELSEGVGFSYGIEKVGRTFPETVARADQILYSMKNGNRESSAVSTIVQA